MKRADGTPTSAGFRPTRGFLRRHAVRLVASLFITGGVLYTAHRGGLKLVPDGGDFGAVHWWVLTLYLPILLGSIWFRAVRWRFLLRSIVEVPKRRLFAISCAGAAAILLLPFRLGELVRPYMLRTPPSGRRDGVPIVTMAAATSSIVAERIIDGLLLSSMLVVVLLLVPTIAPLPDKVVGLPLSVAQVRMSGFAMLALFIAAFVAISVFYVARSWARRVTLVVVGAMSSRVAVRLARLFEQLADGLHAFGRRKDAVGFLVETIAYWALNALGMWLLAWGCGVVHADGSPITFVEACGLMGMLGCAILIPGPPGLLGVFQAGMYAGMTMYYPTEIVLGPGAAFVFILYTTQVVVRLVAGAWGAWHEGGGRRLRDALDGVDDSNVDAPAEARS